MNEERPKPEGPRPGDTQEPGSSDPAAGLVGLPADYPQFLAEIKARIAAARTRAVLAVNSELVQLYWEKCPKARVSCEASSEKVWLYLVFWLDIPKSV
jgi:hypothetical protein